MRQTQEYCQEELITSQMKISGQKSHFIFLPDMRSHSLLSMDIGQTVDLGRTVKRDPAITQFKKCH